MYERTRQQLSQNCAYLLKRSVEPIDPEVLAKTHKLLAFIICNLCLGIISEQLTLTSGGINDNIFQVEYFLKVSGVAFEVFQGLDPAELLRIGIEYVVAIEPFSNEM